MMTRTRLTLFMLGVVALGSSSSARAQPGYQLSAPRFWWRNWAVRPWIALVGDADGDRRADLIAVEPSGAIEIERTSPLGKWVRDPSSNNPFVKDLAAATVGPFTTEAACDVLAVARDGSLHLASAAKRGTSNYTRHDRVGQVPESSLPRSVTRGLSADLNADGRTDVLIPGDDGRFFVLINQPGEEGRPRFVHRLGSGGPRDAVEIELGLFGSVLTPRLVWLDRQGTVKTAALELTQETTRANEPQHLVEVGPRGHLSVGRFLGRPSHDILAGRRLLCGGTADQAIELPVLPAAADSRDLWWRSGDIDGNGMDDLVRKRDENDREGGPEIVIHFSARATDEPSGFSDEDLDGLPDDWETGRIRPGGLDLKALGCKPGHSDVIVEIERFDNVDVPRLKTEVQITVNYFASLPAKSPDGSHGIAMHIVYRPPTPHVDFDRVIKEFDERYPPREHRGVVHSMFCGAKGDPDFAVAGIMGASGRFHLNPIVHDVMSHEFGHELGLTHDAFQPHNSPIYPSVMSYAYILGPGGRFDLARYSEGRFCSLVLNERRLSERLSFPIGDLHFLTQTPYRFRLEAADEKTTRIDWNRNGIFGEENIVADVNYHDGTSTGPLHELGRCDTSPVVLTHGTAETGRLLVFYGRGGSLLFRHWRGKNIDSEGDDWSPEVAIEPAGVLGDPAAVHLAGGTWIAYRTTDHVAIRRIDFAADDPKIGPVLPVADSQEAEPTLASLDGELVLCLWRGADRPIGVRLAKLAGSAADFGPEVESTFTSLAPLAVLEARMRNEPRLWVGVIERLRQGPRTVIGRFRRAPGGRFVREHREIVAGDFCGEPGAALFVEHSAHRMQLLWRHEPGFAESGRLYHLTGRPTSEEQPWSEQYISMQAAVHDTGRGWFSRRYAELASRSAPGACWFRSDMAYALRVHDNRPERDDVLKIGFYGSGALPEPMSDYNDVDFIHRVGLSHSLAEASPETEAATPDLPVPVALHP